MFRRTDVRIMAQFTQQIAIFHYLSLQTELTKVEIVCPDSIYPCLDEFKLIVTKPDLSRDNYIRLVRVYKAQHVSHDVKSLTYIREFKLPTNNLLNFDCQFFSADFKFFCFVFVAKNISSGAVSFESEPLCKPTIILPDDHHNAVEDVTEPQYILDNQIHRLEPAGPSVDSTLR